MFFDNEEDIIDYIQNFLNHNETKFYNNNSFEKKIFNCLKDTNSLIPDNGHDALPPDYFSDKYNMMFDVMRVNDCEISKGNNPVLKRQRKVENKLKSMGVDTSNPKVKAIIISESDDVNEHSFKKYKQNVQRVTEKHISSNAYPNKIRDVWQIKHPNIKYSGFLIFDETECCFEGYIRHLYEDQFQYIISTNKPVVLHEPWNDENFISFAYKEKYLDFIVWACPYKTYSVIPLNLNIHFPRIMIMDVRFPRSEPYIKYDENNLVI